MNKSLPKGNLLEEAVRVIEDTILKSKPSLKNAAIEITPKKIIVAGEVKHEIDLFVTIDQGSGYESTFIFECKNWEKSIGKNEITIFSEKIKVTQAQKGYFVAKKFGKYALAQAKLDPRIELIEASDTLTNLPTFISEFHYVFNAVNKVDLQCIAKASSPELVGTFTPISLDKIQIMNQNFLSPENFLENIRDAVISEIINHLPTQKFSSGKYSYVHTKEFKYEEGQVRMGDIPVNSITATVNWDTHIIRPKIISKFDIKTRGRYVQFEPVIFPNGQQMQFALAAVNS